MTMKGNGAAPAAKLERHEARPAADAPAEWKMIEIVMERSCAGLLGVVA